MSRLGGRVIAVTRDGDPDDRLVALLEAGGAKVVEWPTLGFAPPTDASGLEAAAAAIADYDWVLFTSRRAVAALSDLVPEPPESVAAATVGAATAAEATRSGWSVRLTGDLDTSRMAEELARSHDLGGAALLFPAASLAGDALEETLAAHGARVDRVQAYRTVETPPPQDGVRADLARGVDFVTFASPSAARALTTALGGSLADVVAASRLVAIGPSTAAALRDAGAEDVLVASSPGLEAMVEACAAPDLVRR